MEVRKHKNCERELQVAGVKSAWIRQKKVECNSPGNG